MPLSSANALPDDAPVSPPTARGSAGKSRDQILIAAADCFKENGFAATSIDDVAHTIGATKGMIYHHFRSKMDLFFAVYRRGMEINFEATQPHADSENGDALSRLTRMAMAHTLALMDHQPFQRVLAQGVAMHQTGSTTAAQRETLGELIRSRDTYEALFNRAIESASAEQKIPVANSSVTTKSFLAVLNSTVFWYSPRDGETVNKRIALARDLVTFAVQGLAMQIPETAFEDWERHYE